ncbi:MAG: metal ABC transporter permease [Terrimicrobiaceae bacterium]|nr:metal ABC transporter permease [Terrimicrobiaceae bacterium]
MMDWLLDPFRHEFMQRAFFGCAIIGFTNGCLSTFIVLRRLALMADALAHSLLPGLAVAILLFGLAPVGLFFGAMIAAMIVAIGTQLIARSSRIKEDTSLGLLFACAFSLGLVLLSLSPVRVELHHYLFGNILGLSDADLWVIHAISFLVLPTLVALERPLLLTVFEPSIAASQGIRVNALNYLLMGALVLSMISSLQAVGVVLALGMLVAPAATVYLFSDSFSVLFWGGGLLGMSGSCLGLAVSYWLNLPSGACIVLLLGLIFLVALLLSPKYGVLPRLFRRRHFHEQSLERWKGRDAVNVAPPQE